MHNFSNRSIGVAVKPGISELFLDHKKLTIARTSTYHFAADFEYSPGIKWQVAYCLEFHYYYGYTIIINWKA